MELFDHIRHMLWTTVPSFLIALAVFALIGGGQGAATPEEVARLQDSLREQFDMGPHLLIPLGLMLFLVYRRFPAWPSIVLSALAGALFALIFQPQQVARLAGGEGLPQGFLLLKGLWLALADGFSSSSGNADLDALLSKGGMSSMLNTVWLILCALGFGGVLERTGILNYWLTVALRRVRSTGSLIATTVGTCFATNVLAADQFISVALPGRMYRDAYIARGLSPLNLSRTLEDSATITSALIPWNTCGAYMSATLGIATLSYVPYAFFNLLCPLIAIAYGFANVAQKPLEERLRAASAATSATSATTGAAAPARA